MSNKHKYDVHVMSNKHKYDVRTHVHMKHEHTTTTTFVRWGVNVGLDDKNYKIDMPDGVKQKITSNIEHCLLVKVLAFVIRIATKPSQSRLVKLDIPSNSCDK